MKPPDEYDYILVGSGVAASTLASYLLKAHPRTSILMLEAGPKIPMKDRRYWWDYVLSGREPYEHCTDKIGDNESVGKDTWNSLNSRMMIYGGSTVHWGGWTPRYKPEDFTLQSNTGFGGDWPYRYADLEPYYCKAESYLSVGGQDDAPWRSKPYPLPAYPWLESDGEMIEAFRRLDISPGHMPLARDHKCMTTGTCKYCPIGARFSGSFSLDALLANPDYVNLNFIGGAPVKRLLSQDSKARITQVEYLDPDTAELSTASAQKIVLCGGAYEIPKLLMLSKSAHWKHGIGNDHDLVGRFPVSHRFISVYGQKPSNPGRWFQEFDFPTLMSRSYDSPELQKYGKIFMMRDYRYPQVDFARMMIEGKTAQQIEETLTGPRTVGLSAYMEEFGQHRNRFTPARGETRFGLPRTKICFEEPGHYKQNTKANQARMAEVLREMGCTKIKFSDPGPLMGFHTCSTARMGADESQAVVDADLKVFGTDNLYICSNATLPNCAAVNPTLTLVATALKLIDHLLGNQHGS